MQLIDTNIIISFICFYIIMLSKCEFFIKLNVNFGNKKQTYVRTHNKVTIFLIWYFLLSLRPASSFLAFVDEPDGDEIELGRRDLPSYLLVDKVQLMTCRNAIGCMQRTGERGDIRATYCQWLSTELASQKEN